MKKYLCDGSYRNDLKIYTEEILEKSGISSRSAEREIMCMADQGNTVAGKLCADLIFYGKILRKNPYRRAFGLYLKSAGITVEADGSFHCSGVSYPLSFWSAAYYLVNYRRSGTLKNCEEIDVLEKMPLTERLASALELSLSCLREIPVPGACNMVGRILCEASENQELFAFLKPLVTDLVSEESESPEKIFPGLEFPQSALPFTSIEQCAVLAEAFFQAAAQGGYVYACNNLAAREAERIISMKKEGADPEELENCIHRYIHYLKLSADRYEPYAANRLGLLYAAGEIRGSSGRVIFREYMDQTLAKDYFTKATVYPDSNSAWAFLNLIKYFHRAYDGNFDLLNEHMGYIKELNPEVYDIAMEL